MSKHSTPLPQSPRHIPIFILVTLVASLGAMNSASVGIWGVNPITCLLGEITDLSEAVYVLIGVCGFCLFAFDFKLLVSRVLVKKQGSTAKNIAHSKVIRK